MDVNIRLPSTSQTAVNSDPADSNNTDDSLLIKSQKLAKPLHLQRLERALKLDNLLRQVESTINDKSLDEPLTANISKQQLKVTKTRIYNLSKVKKSKKWLKNILLDKSDSSDSDLESEGRAEECIRDMIRIHHLQKKMRREFEGDAQARQYQNYSSSLLANQSQVSLLASNNLSAGKKSKTKTKRKTASATIISAKNTPFNNSGSTSQIDNAINEPPVKIEKLFDENKYDAVLPDNILQTECTYSDSLSSSNFKLTTGLTSQLPDEIFDTEESEGSVLSQTLSQPTPSTPTQNFSLPKCSTAPATPTLESPSTSPIVPMRAIKKTGKKKSSAVDQEAAMNMKRKRLWIAIARKEIPRAQKQKVAAKKEAVANAKRMANWCQREKRKTTLVYQKQFCRDQYSRARRLTKEMLLYWKRFEKVEKDYRKRAEKEAQEQLRIDIELMEARRQQRKLNFLITQTELYAHFMSRKLHNNMTDETTQQKILNQLDEENPVVFASGVNDNYDLESKKQEALKNADAALKSHQQQTSSFDDDVQASEMNLANPLQTDLDEFLQPKIFKGLLKSYQLKGMNWLYNLYDKGINGILADEMGLGKTVQTIAFFALLAERLDVWGPFLIIAPSSTLHNWQQEFTKFVPKIKVLPYWGNPSDRKVLRKFWNQKYLHREEASFHVLVTSYQLVVQDVKYFQRIKWMYMVLDEAQAIKSTASVRWKLLLAFQCRNRLLLTGTPIQNSMAELWALLHFIMPTMFDSHEEFNEWFSKDIESHAENKTAIDEKHLSRLHMILKPFMLRRVKKDVENELSDKIEIKMFCGLTSRQQLLYKAIKNKISIEDLMLTSSSSSSQTTTSSLMNLVMQFRKVCNHPDLFERRDVRSPFFMQLETFVLPRLLFESGLCFDSFRFNSTRHKMLYNIFSIFSCDFIFKSIYSEDSPNDCFSFLKFLHLSPHELVQIVFGDFVTKWQYAISELNKSLQIHHQYFWKTTNESQQPLLIPLKTRILSANRTNVCSSNDLWSNLLFTGDLNNRIYQFSKIIVHYKPETPEHREMRIRKLNIDDENNGTDKLRSSFNECYHKSRPRRVFEFEQIQIPSFLYVSLAPTNGLRVKALAKDVYCCNQRALRWHIEEKFGGNNQVKSLLIHGDVNNLSLHPHQVINNCKSLFYPTNLSGLIGLRQSNGWSSIVIPDKETLVTDSGKLHALDVLLNRLKDEGHRVLIYSQMTRMIDLLEEFMWHRKHTYMRLDGSSRILDRRDMVADFQNRSDIFVFLLSTRAGGLGINLTAADTVIFYDSDWNPTVDQQAMDRAHRLGQTKQVTVYRLVCKGTIEERILQRAKEKSEIQRMVISGGTFKPDTLKPTEVVSLLLDDEELERKFRQRQAERREQEANSDGSILKSKRKTKNSDQPKRKYTKRAKPELVENEIQNPQEIKVAGIDELSIENDSVPQSPYSEQSFNSLTIVQDEESNEGMLIVDDGSSPTPSRASSTPDLNSPSGTPLKRGTGRSRGRPRGSRARGPIAPRGRGSTVGSAALAAAELAGAQAGKSAALAAYPFLGGSLTGSEDTRASITRRGRGRSRSKVGLIMNKGSRISTTESSVSTPPDLQNTAQKPAATSTTSTPGIGFYVQQD